MKQRITSNFQFVSNAFNSSSERIIFLSTYFTSKLDPMRSVHQAEDNYDYFRNWYESIRELGIWGVIFCDNISDEFKKKYQTDRIFFIKCELGPHSLNDERFFIFYEFVQHLKNSAFVVSTDINDVIVNKNPLKLLEQHPEKLLVGRGIRKTWKDGVWAIKALNHFNRKYNKRLSVSFFNYPMLTPGTIGGKKDKVEKIYLEMISIFSELGDDGNYDMQVFNYIMKESYYPYKSIWDGVIPFRIANWYYYLVYRFSRKLQKEYKAHKYDVVTSEESICTNDRILAGFPFVSVVGKYEKKGVSKAYLIHK
ncbi:hypothetical protein [Algoriphagus formosus]|uniref:hypothetical protein n=1 Tax=Algoriphagus formosus TaxID=2007308 RepID=UPI000C28F67A|nr:hypothetical protein [Algoriphagus formosus]